MQPPGIPPGRRLLLYNGKAFFGFAPSLFAPDSRLNGDKAGRAASRQSACR